MGAGPSAPLSGSWPVPVTLRCPWHGQSALCWVSGNSPSGSSGRCWHWAPGHLPVRRPLPYSTSSVPFLPSACHPPLPACPPLPGPVSTCQLAPEACAMPPSSLFPPKILLNLNLRGQVSPRTDHSWRPTVGVPSTPASPPLQPPHSESSLLQLSPSLSLFFFLAALQGRWNFPDQGLNLCPLQWGPRVLTPAPPGKSSFCLSYPESLLHATPVSGAPSRSP